ncbi:AT-hook motif nuclear-localized protein 10 isoform X2 [Sorghum bicolor]|uniref:AT-hook motif nuclear-localized protein 10 isoform X2 n=1 Tax=Sorghum bicolor TaxID=4558 RepID=UPI000B42616A|nr:AT-hook motif nuclear-localized protein 10 isoform X2 [Sorghum bicolor]|eukprot:XP_021319476.1 AT-hook motif nuclear-localized protein 10 isoform X2 [Sorghum bicolor]
MDGRDQHQHQQQAQAAPRVGSPPQAGAGGGVMMQHAAAFGAAATPPGMPPASAGNVMHGMPLAFSNPMAPSPGASSPMNMKPTDMPPGAMYRADSGAPPGLQQQQHPGSGGGGAIVAVSGGELVKKKRGRPRKYGPDGSIGLGLKSAAAAGTEAAGGQSGGGGGSSSNPDGKRRGRPPGSGKKKQLDALGSSGTSFTPHIITVKPNEDVASKIMAFSQQGPRTTCIISANGALCTATLRQPATSGGIVTYEGHFDILSLSGSFLLAEDGDTRSRTGGLSVALAGSDGRIVGGCVAGMLMAATPVQVVVGSFIAEGKKPKEEQPKREPTSVPPHTAGFGAASTASPPSDGTSSEHSDDPGSPMGPNGSTFTNAGLPLHSTFAPAASLLAVDLVE